MPVAQADAGSDRRLGAHVFRAIEVMMNLSLFQRDECPLCDEAYQVLAAAGVADFDPIWIDGDAALEGIYGMRIPVLRREDSSAELDWPFAADDVRRFLWERL